MKINYTKKFLKPWILLTAFLIFTIGVKFIDVNNVGPQNSFVGFSKLNTAVHNFLGVNMKLYILTDWLSILPIAIVFGFGILGFHQLIKRKNLFKVDSEILSLGIFYIAVIISYLFFEKFVINYRPILINGILEPSYPSSTTVLVICINTTAIFQFNNLISKNSLKNILKISICIFTIFMIVARIFSGVHWITDIFGGILLSLFLVAFYFSINKFIDSKMKNN